MKPTILVVDDDERVREALTLMLQDDYSPIPVGSGKEALEKVSKNATIDLVLLDITMPEMDGIEVLKRIKDLESTLDVIMVTATNTTETAVKTIKYGAYDYVTKPFDNDDLKAIINRALEKRTLSKLTEVLSSELDRLVEHDIVGKSDAMKAVYSMIDKLSDSETTVLIHGESGTGKELVARALHKKSMRSTKPFVAINCAAIPADLVESEFFGHERGAFTSAVSRKIGKFEYADGGIVFLDDVGELPLSVQAKLLRVLQEREIVRVGSNEVIPVDIRIIAATNDNLQDLIKQRRFREDLYYRLKVVPIEIPPLRVRREDIKMLVEHFAKKSCDNHHKAFKHFDAEAMRLLINYNWPGNVRELENMVEMIVLLSNKNIVTTSDLPSNVLTNQALGEGMETSGETLTLKKARHQFERQFILRVLEKLHWNQTRAAKMMGIHRNTLIIKMEELGIKKGIN